VRAFVEHFAFEFRTGVRNRWLLFLTYLLPLGFHLLLASVMVSGNPAFATTMIGVMAVFAVLSATVLGLPNMLVEAREAGIFRAFRVSGVPAAMVLAMPTLTTTLHLVGVWVLIAVTAVVFFDAAVPPSLAGFAAVCILTAFAYGGLGALVGVVAPGSPVAQLLIQAVYLPSLLLGDLLVPAEVLPPALRMLGGLLPAPHAMEAFRALAYRQAPLAAGAASAMALLAGGVIGLVLAVRLFAWDSQEQRRGRALVAVLALLPYMVRAFAG